MEVGSEGVRGRGGGDIETDEGSNMCCREASPLGLLHPRLLDPRQPFILI